MPRTRRNEPPCHERFVPGLMRTSGLSAYLEGVSLVMVGGWAEDGEWEVEM